MGTGVPSRGVSQSEALGWSLEGLLKERGVGQSGWSGEGKVSVVGDRMVARMVAQCLGRASWSFGHC